MTNRELLKELAKPGKVWMPVLTPHDVTHIKVEKAHLIRYLKHQPPDEDAPWCFYGEDQGRAGDRWLDVNK